MTSSGSSTFSLALIVDFRLHPLATISGGVIVLLVLHCHQTWPECDMRERNIRVCVHIINGLPGETYDDMIKTVKDISVLDINAVKIHMLYILKDTPLFKLYEKEKFSVMKREDYIQTVADQIELLPKK